MEKNFVLTILITIPCVRCANILGVFPVPSVSHQSVFQAIYKELSLRGHQVTVVTPIPLNKPELTNLTEIVEDDAYNFMRALPTNVYVLRNKSGIENYVNMHGMLATITEGILKNLKFQELLQDKETKFDLVLIQFLFPALYSLASKFHAPVITISSLDVTTVEYESVGNPNHPLLYPNFLNGAYFEDPTFLDKIEGVCSDVLIRLYYRYFIMPRHQILAEKYIQENTPYVRDLQKNVSLIFATANKIIYTPRPTVPNIIHISRLHIKPVQPLPTDLQEILEDANEGVVYLSLGSQIKSVNFTEDLRSLLTEAVSELPYKVLWKWVSDYMPDQPKNVVKRKWFPQQDILAHRNVKVFVTQGGLQSIEEAMDRRVPLVGIPFYGDQPTNMLQLCKIGAALVIDPRSMTKEQLKTAIMEVATNPKYKNKMSEIRELLEDEPLTSMEKVIWWCEYVIRHKGTPYMKAPIADMSWFRYLFVDVIVLFVFLITVAIYLLYKLVRILLKK